MSVERGWLSLSSAMACYPSCLVLVCSCSVVLGMPIEKEIDSGVSRKHWLLRCWRLTVRLEGVLPFLAVMTIWLHQVVGVPIATRVIPFLTRWSSAALTWPFQWRGTGIGVCCTWGTAPSLTWIWAGFVNITGNRVEQLNVVSRNWSRRYCLS